MRGKHTQMGSDVIIHQKYVWDKLSPLLLCWEKTFFPAEISDAFNNFKHFILHHGNWDSVKTKIQKGCVIFFAAYEYASKVLHTPPRTDKKRDKNIRKNMDIKIPMVQNKV